jgi:hypothetical protein
MPRAGKKDPFFIYADPKKGQFKGRRLMGLNHTYEGNQEELTISDLMKFLKENNIDPSSVKLPTSFTTTVKV